MSVCVHNRVCFVSQTTKIKCAKIGSISPDIVVSEIAVKITLIRVIAALLLFLLLFLVKSRLKELFRLDLLLSFSGNSRFRAVTHRQRSSCINCIKVDENVCYQLMYVCVHSVTSMTADSAFVTRAISGCCEIVLLWV